MDAIGRVWRPLPSWAKWVVGVAGVILLDAVTSSVGDRRFVASVAENFVAKILYYGVPLGSVALGVLAGMRIHTRYSNSIAWIGGISVAFATSFVLFALTSDIPGVSWRLQRMQNSDCYVDWDGRSNSTVCK